MKLKLTVYELDRTGPSNRSLFNLLVYLRALFCPGTLQPLPLSLQSDNLSMGVGFVRGEAETRGQVLDALKASQLDGPRDGRFLAQILLVGPNGSTCKDDQGWVWYNWDSGEWEPVEL